MKKIMMMLALVLTVGTSFALQARKQLTNRP
jgi:hypothetical protein